MIRKLIPVLILMASTASAQITQPYAWSHSIEGNRLSVEVVIPEGAYLYSERTSVDVAEAGAPLLVPAKRTHTDEFGTSGIYAGGQTHRWVYAADLNKDYRITIHYQGCGTPEGGGGAVCYPPATKTLTTGTEGAEPTLPNLGTPGTDGSLDALLDRFEIVRTDGGIKNVDEMMAFLNMDQPISSSAGFLDGKNGFLLILLVLIGGMALNLTPCVLPMIPVNLAIIGAGAAAASKRQGFIRGGVYGLGIALAYGGLGVFAVLTGSKFGTLNASPVFNFIIAGIFILLALSMFGVMNIDLSRFGARFGVSDEKRGRLFPAFIMGIVAALLAGACVAPIVIAVLLQSTTLYANGTVAGLFLPLLLGVGMALPWPIAGAGLAVLPKPGAWMVKVKHTFGVLIAVMALYYGYLGVELLPAHGESAAQENNIAEFENGLLLALEEDRPVFIDFWASWCKNCLKMDLTTFKDETIINRLHDFQEIKFQAEDPGEPEIKQIMDRYGLPGLPGYVILNPKK